MSIRTDIEVLVADAIVSHLQAVIAADTQAVCPVVSWHDPMSIDEANRIVVMVPKCDSKDECAGNYEATVEVAVKSQWAQATLSDDKAAHFARVDELRDALTNDGLLDALNALETNVGFNFIEPRRGLMTKIVDGFFYSETNLTVHVWEI